MARKLPRLQRVLDAPALASVAYGEIASSFYFALGVIARIVRARNGGRAIVDEAVRRGSEIIVMGGPRRIRFAAGKRAIFGDTVDFVLRHASVRVMVAAGSAAS
jgi:nucleotide-binding universal stress UspA family protein